MYVEIDCMRICSERKKVHSYVYATTLECTQYLCDNKYILIKRYIITSSIYRNGS